MRLDPRLAFVVTMIAGLTLQAAPEADLTSELLACWGKGRDPAPCEAPAKKASALSRDERTRLLSALARAEKPTSQSLALWLAVQTRTAFDDPALAERLLKAEDARVLSLVLDYVQVLRSPVHASVVNDLASESPIPNVRAAAIRLMPDLDAAAAVSAAREGLRATSAVVLAAAAGAAGRLKDGESVDALVRLLSDPRYPLTVRLEVTDALRRIGDPTVAGLLYLHLRWPEPMLLRKLITAFGETAPSYLAAFLLDELSGDCVREVMVALARMKSAETTPALVGLFERRDVRDQTLHLLFWALGEIRDPTAIPALLVQLRGADAERATRAAEALGNIGARSAVRPLVEQLANADERVSDMAVWALEKITGQTFEKDRTQWDSWLEQNPY
jgi:HEAT repeat protein